MSDIITNTTNTNENKVFNVYVSKSTTAGTALVTRGSLNKTDPKPTVVGLYILEETGIYPNLGNIDAKAGKLNFASFDGTTWSLIAVDLPQPIVNNYITENTYNLDPNQIVPSEALYNDTSSTLAGDVLKRVDINTGEDVNYRETTTWHDGSPMEDTKADGVIYIKKNNKYYKRQFEGVVNVKWFGAKGDGITDDGLAIQKAIDFLKNTNRYLFFEGTFKITADVYLKAGMTLDFRKASFIKAGTFDYLLNASDNTDNVTILGGKFIKTAETPLVNIETGQYVNANAIHFSRSKNIVLDGCYFDPYFVCADFYDCNNVTVKNCITNYANASFAFIVSQNALSDLEGFICIDNKIVSGGDDGIMVGGNGSSTKNIKNVLIQNNIIDKKNKNVLAAVPIRFGNYEVSTAKVYNSIISNNIITETTTEGIFITHSEGCIISNNIISDFGKFTKINPAITIQECKDISMNANKIKNPLFNCYGIFSKDNENLNISENTIEANNIDSCIYFDNTKLSKISKNNIKNLLSATIQLQSGSNNNDIDGNTLTSNGGSIGDAGIGNTNTNNRFITL